MNLTIIGTAPQAIKARCHFPFFIFHFLFLIEENPSMTNIKWKMENGKWKMNLIYGNHDLFSYRHSPSAFPQAIIQRQSSINRCS
jgi:hypothetical protein